MNRTVSIRSKPELINQTSQRFAKCTALLEISVLTMALVATANAQVQRNVMELFDCDLNGYAFDGIPFGTYDFGGSAGSQETGAASMILQNFPFPLPETEHGDSPLRFVAGQLKSTSQIDLFGYGSDDYYIRFVTGTLTVFAGLHPDLSGVFATEGGILQIEIHKGSLSGPVVGGNQTHEFDFVFDTFGTYTAAPPEDALIIEGVNHDIPGFNPAAEFWPTNFTVRSTTTFDTFVDATGSPVVGLLSISFRPARKTEPPSVFVDKVTNPNGSLNAGARNPNTSQNGGFYLVRATDNSDPQPKVFVRDSASGFVAGPFDSGDYLHITRAQDDPPSVQLLTGVVTARLTVQGDVLVYAVDLAGNISKTIDVTLKSGN